MNILFNCLAATRLISKSQHVKLTFADELSMKVHVALCKYCKSFQKDLNLVKIELEKIDSFQPQNLNENFKKKLTETLLVEINKKSNR